MRSEITSAVIACLRLDFGRQANPKIGPARKSEACPADVVQAGNLAPERSINLHFTQYSVRLPRRSTRKALRNSSQ